MDKKIDKNIIRVGFIALGCPKAVVDSEKMLADIAQANLVITADPDEADVVVINTCGFIEPAKTEAFEVIKHSLECKNRGTVDKVVVAGCLSERMGDELFEQLPGIDAVVGLGQRDNLPDIIKKIIQEKETGIFLEHCDKCPADDTRLLLSPGHWAYLRISEGCDHRCSFCTIPMIRGRFRSKPPENVIAEARQLVESGAVELNLIAQDTAYYGTDIKMRHGLVKLIAELDKISGLDWIRLLYIYPERISDRLIETINYSEKTLPYLDIPIQHINSDILKRMRRPDTSEKLHRLIEKLREQIPGLVLRTTVIVGFPGETQSQFEELLEFVEWAKFDALGCFRFYGEAGTDAADMPGQIPDDIKAERLEQIMLKQQEIAFEKNTRKKNQRLKVLVDHQAEQQQDSPAVGRYYGQAPDIDSVCLINNCSVQAGNFIEAEVVGSRDYDLIVRQLDEG